MRHPDRAAFSPPSQPAHPQPHSAAAHLEVAHNVDVLQAAQRGDLPHDARVRPRRVRVQRDLLHRVLPPVQAVDGWGWEGGGEEGEAGSDDSWGMLEQGTCCCKYAMYKMHTPSLLSPGSPVAALKCLEYAAKLMTKGRHTRAHLPPPRRSRRAPAPAAP